MLRRREAQRCLGQIFRLLVDAAGPSMPLPEGILVQLQICRYVFVAILVVRFICSCYALAELELTCRRLVGVDVGPSCVPPRRHQYVQIRFGVNSGNLCLCTVSGRNISKKFDLCQPLKPAINSTLTFTCIALSVIFEGI